MKITCQSCQSKYTIADEKIQGRVAKVRCRKCGAAIVVDASPAEHAPAAEVTWSVTVDDGQPHTMSTADVVAAYQSSTISADTYVWREGMGDWLPLRDVPELVDALHAAAPEAAMEPAPAAQPEEESVATSAGEAHAFTGARDEQSVLFSLSALTATSSRPVTAPAAAKAATTEDSGLIDLGALVKQSQPAPTAAAAPATPAAPPAQVAFFPPALGTVQAPAPAAPAPPPPAPRSNTPIFIGVGVAVVAIGVAIGVIANRPAPEPAPTAVATASAAPTALATATATATPTVASAQPAASATAAPSATAAATARKPPATAVAGGAPKTATPVAAPPKAATPASTPPAAGGKKAGCGCAPADLTCQIKCSSK